MFLKEAKEFINQTIKLYHYVKNEETVNNILKDGYLKSISYLIKNKELTDKEELNKYVGRLGYQNPEDYFKHTYNVYNKHILKKDYSTTGIFLTTVDLFKFDNKMKFRLVFNYDDFKNSVEMVHSVDGRYVKITNSRQLEILSKPFINMSSEELQIRYFSGPYAFSHLPQIQVFIDKIKIRKEIIEKR